MTRRHTTRMMAAALMVGLLAVSSGAVPAHAQTPGMPQAMSAPRLFAQWIQRVDHVYGSCLRAHTALASPLMRHAQRPATQPAAHALARRIQVACTTAVYEHHAIGWLARADTPLPDALLRVLLRARGMAERGDWLGLSPRGYAYYMLQCEGSLNEGENPDAGHDPAFPEPGWYQRASLWQLARYNYSFFRRQVLIAGELFHVTVPAGW